MEDQAINALSTKTAPETSDQLLLVGAGEPQLIDYDKLADAILNKITSKNYDLDAGQMTLLAALNKLNSESLIGNVTTIDDITFDYNSFTKTGLYYINGPKNQSESDNKPGDNVTNCFMMVLAKTDYRCFQIIFPGNTQRIFYRNTKTDASGWNSWKTL